MGQVLRQVTVGFFTFFRAINTYLTKDPQGRARLKKEACDVIPLSSFYKRF